MSRLLQLLIAFAFISFYSSASNQWVQRADFGNFGRHRAVAVGIGNKAYAGTGHLNGDGTDEWFSEWWEYDPATNAWTQKADYIGHNGAGDQDLTAIAIDGIGYISGGWYGGAGHYKYDPTTNTWTELNTPPSSFSNTDPFVINGKGYYLQWGGSNAMYMYDPGSDAWSFIGTLPTAMNQRCGTFVIGGKGYVKKDYSFYEFDPITLSWTQKANFPGTAPNNNIGLSQGGYGFYIGGYLGWGDMYQEVWRYDPVADSWAQMEDYPFAARRWAVKAKVGERCYMGLGTNGTNFNDWWEFMPMANLEEESIEVSVYPNPASDVLNIKLKAYSTANIQLIDLEGRVIIDQNLQGVSLNINVQEVKAGTYFVRVRDEEATSSSKVMIVH